MLAREFEREDRMIHLDLGSAVDLRDRDLAYDGHLTAAGNAIIARHLVDPVLELTRR